MILIPFIVWKPLEKNNPYGEDNVVFISIYDTKTKQYYEEKIHVICESREKNKKQIINHIIHLLETKI